MAKVLLSIDDRLLRRLDRAAKALGLSRSAYLARLVQRELDGEKGPGAGREARDALRRIDELAGKHGASEDPVEAIRLMRDSR